jgi:hypothetical protein
VSENVPENVIAAVTAQEDQVDATLTEAGQGGIQNPAELLQTEDQLSSLQTTATVEANTESALPNTIKEIADDIPEQ